MVRVTEPRRRQAAARWRALVASGFCFSVSACGGKVEAPQHELVLSVLPESGANYFMLCDDQGTFEGALQGSIRVSYDEGCSNPCSGTMTTLTLASIETTGASESVPLFDFGQIGHSTGEVQFSPDGTPTFVSFRAIVPTGHVVTAAGTLSLAEAPLNPWGIGIDAKGGFSAPFIVEAEPMGGCSWSVLVQPGGSVENR